MTENFITWSIFCDKWNSYEDKFYKHDNISVCLYLEENLTLHPRNIRLNLIKRSILLFTRRILYWSAFSNPSLFKALRLTQYHIHSEIVEFILFVFANSRDFTTWYFLCFVKTSLLWIFHKPEALSFVTILPGYEILANDSIKMVNIVEVSRDDKTLQ